MIIDHAHRFIFIHIPKNAGSSLELALTGSQNWNAVDKHLTASECRLRCGQKNWDEYFSFCIVRNPWDRLVSQFSFSGRNWCRRYFGREVGFDTFVREIVARGLPFSRHDYLSKTRKQPGDRDWLQISRITDNEGNIIIDYIGHFENLSETFEYICKKIHFKNAKLPHTNRTELGGKPYWEFYSDETAKIVSIVFSEDIERFGYVFGE